MNENENNDEVIVGDEEENNEEIKEEVKVEKPKRTPEEELAYFEGRAARLRKQLGFEKTEPKKEAKPNLSETDYGLLAFLTAKGLEHEDDIALFNKVRAETGKKPEEILSSKYFLAELKEQQEIRATKSAQPKGNERGSSNNRDDAQYWYEKTKSGKATMADVPEALRYKVVELKAQSSSQSSPLLDKIAQNLRNK